MTKRAWSPVACTHRGREWSSRTQRLRTDRRGGLMWQVDGERRALTNASAAGRHRPAMKLDETTNNREPDPQSSERTVRRTLSLPEHLEDVWKERGADAAPRVGHGENDIRALTVHVGANLTAGWRVLHGVVQQIPDHLLEPGRISDNAGQ